MALGLASFSPREQLVGLDIGDRIVAAAQIEAQEHGLPDLTRAAWESLPANATDADVITALRALWPRGGLTSYTVCSCLRSSAAAVRHFRFPNLKDGELEAALWLDAEEVLQMERRDIVMDWHEHTSDATAPRGGESPPRGREGILVALPRAEVDAHLAVLREAGLFPVVVDVACTAVCNLFARIGAGGEPGRNALCLVSLADRQADMAILCNDGSLYPRTLSLREDGWEHADDFLITNLHDMLNYYRFKLRRKPVEQVLLTGLIPEDEAFPSRIEASLGLPVKAWNPLNHVRVKAWKLFQTVKHDPRAGTTLAACMGMALRR